MATTHVELRSSSVTMRIDQPQPISRTRAYIVEGNRVAMEFEIGGHTLRFEFSDVEARDISKMLRQVVDEL